MTVFPRLYAKGYNGETPVYFWGLGNYKYEIFDCRGATSAISSTVLEASYEEAMEKFEKMVDKVELL
jgi:hypothetical protein